MAARLLSTQGIDSTLIDYDGDHIEMTAKFGSRVFYGDAGDMDLLRTAGAAHMDIIVVAIDNVDKTTQIVKEVKQQFPQAKVLARARNRNHMYDLLDEGVDFAERETLRGGLALGREALRFMGMTDQRSEQVAREFLSHDFASIKESMEMRGDEDALIAHSHEARETVKQALQSDAEHWGKKKSDDV
jgi:voltage-gated potassium channel Kch